MSGFPKVLLLGDSIRMSYPPVVAEILKGRADVVGPSDNCQYALFTLSSLDRWLGELGQPDVVHWNNGLHDAGHNPNRSPVQIPLDMYRDNLEFILMSLKALAPHVIWATTTPVHPSRPFRNEEWSWRNEEMDRYNESALKLMAKGNVPVHDLHEVVWRNIDEYLSKDQLHLSGAGQKACGQAVAQAVSAYLPAS